MRLVNSFSAKTTPMHILPDHGFMNPVGAREWVRDDAKLRRLSLKSLCIHVSLA